MLPLSMGFPRQEYWSGLPFASPGDLPNPGIKPVPAWAGGFLTTEPPRKPSNLPNSHCLNCPPLSKEKKKVLIPLACAMTEEL